MNEFLTTSLTFPTLPFSILLAFCVIYWLLAASGLVDALQLDAGPDIGDTGDTPETAAMAGILARLGLGGVPLMAMLAVLSFVCWICSYYLQILLLQMLHPSIRLLAGVLCLLATLVIGVLITSVLLRPVRRLLRRLRPAMEASLLGKEGTVISPIVDPHQGRAEFADGGAGLILQVRSQPGSSFTRGERVVLLSQDHTNHLFTVISATEFNHR